MSHADGAVYFDRTVLNQGLALNRSYHALILICGFLLMGLTGCKMDNGLVPPTATVEGVRVLEQTQTGARVEITVRMENPNTFALPLKSVDFSVVLEGLGQFKFTDTPHVTLSGKRTDGDFGPGMQLLKLPAAVVTNGKSAHGVAYRASGSIVYEPPGEIRKLLTESNVPLPTMNFSNSGTVE